ncbi:hypothetical protein N3K66_001520 [Trichothecium roseum]|uniref:Uncharacterized protein n=1 Tax=Trichothecium roseum TaxID=47278 RepID=A0ACC0VEV2_9HYPO|nr:hypothetical protein N3K66_001520 [Trichothecium roseum]
MALPVVKSLQDCGDYTKTVEPFIPQLYELPYRVLDSIGSLDSLKHIYIETNPLVTGLDVSIFLGFIFLVVSEINRNYSQVDRLWSILPNLYIVHFALWARLSGVPSSRLELAAAFSTLWSARLTYNYARKGGYNIGSEDYRWEILQRYVPKWVWFIFNVTFISFIQSVLLFSFSGVPAYALLVSTQHQPNVTAGDLLFFGVEVGLVVSEWFSDGQQWDYQTGKQEYKESGKVTAGYKKEDYERGFITSGLWAYIH